MSTGSSPDLRQATIIPRKGAVQVMTNEWVTLPDPYASAPGQITRKFAPADSGPALLDIEAIRSAGWIATPVFEVIPHWKAGLAAMVEDFRKLGAEHLQINIIDPLIAFEERPAYWVPLQPKTLAKLIFDEVNPYCYILWDGSARFGLMESDTGFSMLLASPGFAATLHRLHAWWRWDDEVAALEESSLKETMRRITSEFGSLRPTRRDTDGSG